MEEKRKIVKEFSLPVDIQEVGEIATRDLIIVSIPKMGKGTILGQFTKEYNSIIFDLEKGGYDYIPARKLSIWPSEETSMKEAYENYIKMRNLLLENKGKYDYLIVDGLSDLDRLSEIGGTYLFMDSVMGKTFNRRDGKKIECDHPDFKPVIEFLKDGGGYKWTREWFMEQIEIFRRISPYRIYAAHMADKYIKDNQKDVVVGSEIQLTGKLKNILASKVTALAKLSAEDNKRFLNFEVGNDSIIAGSRNPKLSGRILISEKLKDGSVTTYWQDIYKK